MVRPKAADAVARIRRFNRQRDPALVARKYAEMRTSAFAFFRGTCHLFYEDLPKRSLLARAPRTWISGDLHPENFGSFRGADGVVYFDVNDFDEAALAPCTWDVLRCMTGIQVGARELGVLEEDAAALSRRYLYAYRACLSVPAPHTVTADASSGIVRELLTSVRLRASDAVAVERSEQRGKKRRIIIDGVHAAPLDPERRKIAKRLFKAWNAAQKKSNRLALLDVAERIAGTGSMGVARFVVLARRKRRLHLMDVKFEPTGSLAPFLAPGQPKWSSEAERVVWAQEHAQANAPTPLAVVRDGRRSFVFKELQPSEDRARWSHWHGRLERLEHVMATMGQVTAWGHLRCAGVRGAAKAKQLAAFGKRSDWLTHAVEYAYRYAAQVEADFAAFRRASIKD